MPKTYNGSCHCGAVRFEADLDLTQSTYGVNVGCLEGITEEELSKIPITYVDGMNDNWGEPPAFASHL